MRLQNLGLLAVLVLGGCDSAIVASGGPQSGEELVLTLSTPERVTGSYQKDGVALRFDAARTATAMRVMVSAQDGREVVRMEDMGSQYEVTILGGQLKTIVTKDFIARQQAAGNTEPNLGPEMQGPNPGLRVEGDPGAPAKLAGMPEYAALPWLSRALGARGVTGVAYPATLPLHKFSLLAVKQLGTELPPLENQGPQQAYCQSHPNRSSGCYGMCGNGCNCLSWVCGDCCWHLGCYLHDYSCRHCEWYEPWNCAFCYDGLGYAVALYGC